MFKKGRRNVGLSEGRSKDFKNKSALMEASKKQRELNTNPKIRVNQAIEN